MTDQGLTEETQTANRDVQGLADDCKKLLLTPQMQVHLLKAYASQLQYLLTGATERRDDLLRVVYRMQATYDLHSILFQPIFQAADIVMANRLTRTAEEVEREYMEQKGVSLDGPDMDAVDMVLQNTEGPEAFADMQERAAADDEL